MNRKGFSLIELLAVIIVLAVVILITTPVILGVIDDAKSNAAIDSMYMYVKAVETSVNADPKVAGLLNDMYTTKNSDLYIDTTLILDVQSKGTKPNDNGTVKMVNGDVEEARLVFSGYNIVYKNKKAIIEKGATPTPGDKTYLVGDEVYFNPITGVKCTKGQEWTFSNTSSNCYKWNVVTLNDKESNSKVELLLDHNIITDEAYNIVNNSGPSTELWNKIENVTGIWKNIDTFTDADYVELDGSTKPYRISYASRKIKIPSTSLIVSIVGKTADWNPGGKPISVNNKSFLYQNLTNSISLEDGKYCYWTDQAATYGTDALWVVDSSAQLYNDYWARVNLSNCGIRPVIRISKTNL